MKPYDAAKDLPYDQQYPHDYEGKIVLDVGADWGSTAEYFLSHGALKVVAVEANQAHYDDLVKNTAGMPVTPIQCNVSGHSDWERLINTHAPDVVKADCEGCEAHLVDVPSDVLGKCSVWIVETHNSNIYSAVTEKFRLAGFSVSTICEGTPEGMGTNVRIIKCEKSEYLMR